jgi:hypothetical protein
VDLVVDPRHRRDRVRLTTNVPDKGAAVGARKIIMRAARRAVARVAVDGVAIERAQPCQILRIGNRQDILVLHPLVRIPRWNSLAAVALKTRPIVKKP